MKIKFSIFFFGVLLLVSGCVSHHEKMLYNKKSAFYSYILGDVQGNRVNAEYEADAYVVPASCQKTIFALLAYKMFGADYRYETKLYVTKKDSNIHDVVISFVGDPTLKSADLSWLLKSVSGVTITGKILLDVSAFKISPYSSNIAADDIGTEYAQPAFSANIDHNLITVKVRPSKKTGRSAIITNDSGYPMDSSVTTTWRPSSIRLSMINNRLKISGNIRLRGAPVGLKISPPDLEYYLLCKTKSAMKRAGVKGKVAIIRDQTQLPNELILRNISESEPLGSIIPPALKKSDNWIFDNLYLKIIHSQNVNIKDWNDGSVVVRDLIAKYFGVDTANSVFVDGSGLSRYNRLQPRKLFAILKKGYDITEFVDALPSPGEPKSTLAKRTDLSEDIKAKTGNMSGISCLCGYRVNNHPKAFVIIANGFSFSNRSMFPIMDNFVNHNIEN